MNRICINCKSTLDIKYFHLRHTGTYRKTCRACMREDNVKRYHAKKNGTFRPKGSIPCGRRTFGRLVVGANNRGNQFYLFPFDLWKIAKRQKLICPYTKEKLTSKTISLDHIIPLAQGGQNIPSNCQLVHYQVNIAKSSLLHQDFVNLCHCIAENHSDKRSDPYVVQYVKPYVKKELKNVPFSSCAF